MKNLFSICLILICVFLLPGLAQAESKITEEQAIEQLVHELSLVSN